MAKKNSSNDVIIQNRKAFHDYIIHDKFEAGLVLEGWEVKAIKANRAQIQDSYITVKENACWLLGAHITPLNTTAQFSNPDPTRTRKLLLHKREVGKLFGQHKIKGQTIVPLRMYSKKGLIKIEIALTTGKKLHDKRQADKERTWQREKQSIKHFGKDG